MASMGKTILVACFGLCLIAGCTEQQKQQGDKLATNATTAATTVATVSPAIPPPYGTIAGILAGVVLAVAGAWQTYRKGQVSAALDDLGVAAANPSGKSVLELPVASQINQSTVDELKTLGH